MWSVGYVSGASGRDAGTRRVATIAATSARTSAPMFAESESWMAHSRKVMRSRNEMNNGMRIDDDVAAISAP
jgi:hypothetical protein